MKKKTLLTAMMASILALGFSACGSSSDDGDDDCVSNSYEQTCTGMCGVLSDNCGKEVNCGSDCGDGQTCSTTTNTCIPISGPEPGDICDGRCGVIKDENGQDKDCGTDCGANATCVLESNVCEPIDCAIDVDEFCANKCGILEDPCGYTQDCGLDCGDGTCNEKTNTCEGGDIFYCENKCGIIRVEENVYLPCSSVNTELCACTGDAQCPNGGCNKGNGACVDSGTLCLSNDNCADNQFCDLSSLVDELYGLCAIGDRGSKKCGEESLDGIGMDCEYGLAVDGADGKSYCSCDCPSDGSSCPAPFTRCFAYMNMCAFND